MEHDEVTEQVTEDVTSNNPEGSLESMDNYSNMQVPTFPGFVGFDRKCDKNDGIEGKDAVLIHALHDAGDKGRMSSEFHRDSKENIIHVLENKFHMGEKFDRKIDDLECKLSSKLCKIEEKVDEFERRRLDRVIKEQDDKIQELKTRLLILTGGTGPTVTS